LALQSGLDDFGARYYSSQYGRFMSPDWSAQAEPVPYAKLDDPQSLNLYSYVLNNPSSKADPDGHADKCGDGAGSCLAEETGSDLRAQKQTAGQQQNQQSTQHGVTIGVGLAGNAEAGDGKVGVEANGSAVATLSASSKGVSAGVAASGGAVAYDGNHVAATPTQDPKPLVGGAYAGGGVTVMVSNAASSNQLSGPFQTISGNVGGGQGASVSLSFDHNGTFVLQVTLGPGLGLSAWSITTNTKAGCAGPGCQ